MDRPGSRRRGRGPRCDLLAEVGARIHRATHDGSGNRACYAASRYAARSIAAGCHDTASCNTPGSGASGSDAASGSSRNASRSGDTAIKEKARQKWRAFSLSATPALHPAPRQMPSSLSASVAQFAPALRTRWVLASSALLASLPSLARPLAVFAQDESAIRDVIAMAIANRVIKISALISEGGPHTQDDSFAG